MRIMVLLLCLIAAPASQALSLTQPEALDGFLPMDLVPVSLTATVSCETLLQAAPPPTFATTLDVAVETSDEILWVGASSYPLSSEGCQPMQEKSVRIDGNISATWAAEAGKTQTIAITASVAGSDDEPAMVVMTAAPGFDVEFELSTPAAVKQGGPQKEIRFDVEINYTANGPALFTFAAAGVDAGQAVVPEPVIVDAGTGSTIATLLYATPYENGNNAASDNFTLIVQAAWNKGGDVVATQSMELTGRTKGLYVPSPAAALPLALLGAALLRRR